jgi:hypothetical protein
MMSPWSAAVGGALISGVVMYTVGERTQKVDAFAQPAPVEYVQTVDGRLIPVAPVAQPAGYSVAQPAGYPAAQAYPAAAYGTALRPVAAPVPETRVVERVGERPAARQTVYRTAPAQERVVERAPDGRSWKKTAMIIGGSSAAGAGVGGLMSGKKGALIGAAIGGGAASIYEATKR